MTSRLDTKPAAMPVTICECGGGRTCDWISHGNPPGPCKNVVFHNRRTAEPERRPGEPAYCASCSFIRTARMKGPISARYSIGKDASSSLLDLLSTHD